MIDIRRQIEQSIADDSVKEILRVLAQQSDQHYSKRDYVFTDEKRGVVVRNADNGRYYRITVSGTTPTVGVTDLGTKVP